MIACYGTLRKKESGERFIFVARQDVLQRDEKSELPSGFPYVHKSSTDWLRRLSWLLLVLESRLFKTFGNPRHPTAFTDGSSMRQIGRTKEKSTLGKDSIVVGFSLFAMFFGAGNLIFPPTLGQLSGDLWAWGLVGFLLVDAVLSCLGVFVVSRLGGPRGAFDGTLGKIGGTILTTVAILCLCVVFAMPRTAATTFELSVAPYLGEDENSFLVPFSILFTPTMGANSCCGIFIFPPDIR